MTLFHPTSPDTHSPFPEKSLPRTTAPGADREERACIVFLSNARAITPLPLIQQRIAQWSGQATREARPARIVFGGNMTPPPVRTPQISAFLSAYGPQEAPITYLSGVYEGVEAPPADQAHPASACPHLEITGVAEALTVAGHRIWLLPGSNAAQAAGSVDTFLADLHKPGHPDAPSTDAEILVLASFHPSLAGEERLQQLEQAPARIHWVCGPDDEAQSFASGSLCVTLSAGLDPIRARGSLPELIIVHWKGACPSVQRRPVPSSVISPPRLPIHRLGLAFRGTAEALLHEAIARQLPAIQFHYAHSFGQPSAEALELAQTYRQTVPDGFLSLHLPNFSHPAEGLHLSDQEAHLQFAEAIGVDDLTIHLPSVPANMLYDLERRFHSTPWATRCLETYTHLALCALGFGAQISFENVYNKQVHPPGGERLATQPWQLLRFVEEIRHKVAQSGSGGGAGRIGIIFDVGHAFADVQFSHLYGLADWLSQIAPYLQLAHLHQVVPTEGGIGTRNHQPIHGALGPLVNFQGLLSAFHDVSARGFPLLIEVRKQEEALESYRTLQQAQRLVERPEASGALPVFLPVPPCPSSIND